MTGLISLDVYDHNFVTTYHAVGVMTTRLQKSHTARLTIAAPFISTTSTCFHSSMCDTSTAFNTSLSARSVQRSSVTVRSMNTIFHSQLTTHASASLSTSNSQSPHLSRSYVLTLLRSYALTGSPEAYTSSLYSAPSASSSAARNNEP